MSGLKLVAAVILVFAALSPADGPATRPGAEQAIPIREALSRGLITGTLGEPFGRLITVRGTVVDGDKLARKEYASQLFIEVAQVGKRKLPEPVLIRWTQHPFVREKLAEPKPGETVSYIGYESGGFGGIVDGQGKYVGDYADTGFYFKTWFVALKLES